MFLYKEFISKEWFDQLCTLKCWMILYGTKGHVHSNCKVLAAVIIKMVEK